MTNSIRQNLLTPFEELRWDLWLAAITVGLVIFGVVMVYSASAAAKNPNRFLFSQVAWALMGLAALAVLQRVDYHRYANPAFVYGFLGVCVLMLLVVFIFPRVNGAHRWIVFRPLGISGQPSELAKLAMIIFLGWFLSDREKFKELDNFWATMAPALVVWGALAALIVKEPDLGTTMMLGIIFVAMVFSAGVPMAHLYKFVPVLAVAGVLLVMKVAWRLERIKVFLDPESDPLGKGYQPLQALIAIGSGGTNGFGYGLGKQKLSFLPAPQSDYIFAVISEELGLYATATLVLVFGVLLWRGLRAAHHAPDRLGNLLAVGITTAIVTQAFFNISVSLNLLPSKGITLPFVSAGGTSLFISLAAMGVLLNVSGQGIEAERARD
ncbi:MAG TPA: putative peptidoglycan glycosyltransferase FtsW [Blastocatellia bacterium]|nr:putative peptidoglycan glycosyltransferase FtsW [Blastocatellia bacterium]